MERKITNHIANDGFDRGIINFIKEQHDFILKHKEWWIPDVADKLFCRWDQIRKAMLWSANPEITDNHYWFCSFYNIMIHPLYLWEKKEDLHKFTDFMNRFLNYYADRGKITDGYLADAGITNVGSHSRSFLLDGHYKQSFEIVEKLEKMGKESILNNINDNIKNTTSHKRREAKFLTFLEIEKGLASMLEGGFPDSINHLWKALKYAKESKWFPVVRQVKIFLSSANRLMGRSEESRCIIMDCMNERRGFQPRREAQQYLEFAKLVNDEKTRLESLRRAERTCKFYGITERVLLVNIQSEKSKILSKLGYVDAADEALTRATILGMEEMDEQRLLIW